MLRASYRLHQLRCFSQLLHLLSAQLAHVSPVRERDVISFKPDSHKHGPHFRKPHIQSWPAKPSKTWPKCS